ncbi:MAG: hypothetical protein ACI8XB_001073 [Patiriisocius sp.]|jgi:hypothetical protein
MSEFSEFLKLGFFHILDYSSLDHLLFVAALTIGYGRGEINKLIILLTAFTVGHAITLGLAVSDKLFLDEKYVEFLIPLTIIITGVYHLATMSKKGGKMIWIYLITIFFGLIHGMGYASTFKSLYGSSEKILAPILQFNLGVELGQLLAVFIFFKAGRLIKRVLNISDKTFKAYTAGVVIAVAFMMLWQNRIFF